MSTVAIARHPSLSGLPNEILALIFDHLFDGHRGLGARGHKYSASITYSTLYALALTCRSLSHVARDLLQQKCVQEFRHPVVPFAQRTVSEPYHWDTYPHCRHIEMSSDAWTPRRPFYEGQSEEELEAGLGTQEAWPKNTRKILRVDPAQIDLALLVARSPNLRVFIMEACHTHVDKNGSGLPVWLYPIILVAQNNLLDCTHDPSYSHLRTIDIKMQDGFSPDLAYLFALPSLRTLRLNGVYGEEQIGE